ncbi:arylsulfatase B isoform X2 [Cephus cinctus]|nr:arylsulfatase B isoform X2 [Cephus cinctus]XP_015600612.1 arylsulfatase B isoform X2 [Cephus cinctus]
MSGLWLRLASLLVVFSSLLANPSRPAVSGTLPPSPTSSSSSTGRTGNGDHDIGKSERPNIIIILADDMGWNDVSFHGSNQIPTPNIDALAYNGVILNNHYVPALCTPSRSALMTGKYPIHTGMQHSVILEPEPRGLPLRERLLPQYLREAGYRTHAVGKWHLGYYRREYTPTYRGFDSHFGYWNGLQDYYSHQVEATYEGYRGFDMRRNMSVAWETAGKYSTDLFTEEAVRLIENHRVNEPMFMYLAHLAPHTGNQDNPFQAPDDEIAKFSHILDPERRIYAAMVSKLDQSVGEVVAALRRRGMLENSIVLFMSDNGAPTMGIHSNRGSNYPMRGIKDSPWEGAVRGVAAIWSPLIKKPRRVSNQLMYVADWLPTFYSAAGLDTKDLGNIDGVDMWSALVAEKTSPRSEIVINIDDIENYAAIRRGDFKYVIGTTNNGEEWYGETGRPGREDVEGSLPEYVPDLVLRSRAGIAISGVITASQLVELRKLREGKLAASEELGTRRLTTRLLTPMDILRLRSAAELKCNVKEEEKVSCNPLDSPCLFNVKEDPCEMINLAKTRPVILATLEEALMKYRVTAIPANNVDTDPMANPVYWNGTWVNWKDANPMEFMRSNRQSSGRISGPAIAAIAILLGLAIVVAILLFTLKFRRSSPEPARHTERGTFHKVQRDSLNLSEPVAADSQMSEISLSLQGFRELASLKDLARNID